MGVRVPLAAPASREAQIQRAILLACFAILQLLTIKVGEARADYANEYGAVVCQGGQFLVRFATASNEERPRFDPKPPSGAGLARLPFRDPSRCRLSDGRNVVLRNVSMRDGLAYGMCGGDRSQIFSLWLGGRKVYNRALQRGKCDSPYAITAIHYDGARLLECRAVGNVGIGKALGQTCRDASERLNHAAPDKGRPGHFALVRAAPRRSAFCRSLVHRDRRWTHSGESYPGYRPWPAMGRWPDETAHPNESSADSGRFESLSATAFDLDNDGRRDSVLWVEQDRGFFDGSFWAVLPSGTSPERAKALAAELRDDPDEAIPNVRARGIKVYAGDQTAYREPRYVRLTPLFREGKTWLHARWPTEEIDLPSELVLLPLPSGQLRTVCEFKALPDL